MILDQFDIELLDGNSMCLDCGYIVDDLCHSCNEKRERLLSYVKTSSRRSTNALRGTEMIKRARDLCKAIIESHRDNPKLMEGYLWTGVIEGAKNLDKVLVNDNMDYVKSYWNPVG